MKKHLQEMKRPSLAGFARHALAAAVAAAVAAATPVFAKDKPEKPDVKFGFIKLTDMAPLAVAYEKGYFEEEGLFVTLEAQANWKVLLDRVISGELDGAHMLAGQPIAATIASVPALQANSQSAACVLGTAPIASATKVEVGLTA